MNTIPLSTVRLLQLENGPCFLTATLSKCLQAPKAQTYHSLMGGLSHSGSATQRALRPIYLGEALNENLLRRWALCKIIYKHYCIYSQKH